MPKTMVITGCSTGLGRATALHCAALGWQVWAAVRRPADADSLLAEAGPAAATLTPVLCDITNSAQVAALAQQVGAATPGLDVLVNNAGTSYPGPLELLPLDELRAQLEINVVAHLGVSQALLPLLKAARGLLINISSVGGRVAYPLNGPYHMSKFALEAMSDSLRVELAPFGVRVVVVEPGASPTAIWQTSLARGLGSAARARAAAYAPLIESVRRAALAGAERGFPPAQFARLIQRIAASRRPAPRYVIPGLVSWIIFARWHLPDRLWDWGVRRVLKW
ncbi:MAG: SDR family NAD(P)-dependent oxidoreductase [Anaerolineales bacterium]|nr:SDR family NAD(P)-dependent oxidoreductase [Anaerolineales bacterium]